jgi:hypothetical protein
MKILDTLIKLRHAGFSTITQKELAKAVGIPFMEFVEIMAKNRVGWREVNGYGPAVTANRINIFVMLQSVLNDAHDNAWIEGKFWMMKTDMDAYYDQIELMTFSPKQPLPLELSVECPMAHNVVKTVVKCTPENIQAVEKLGWTKWKSLSFEEMVTSKWCTWTE